jgi:hypothetical protein
VSRRLKQPMPMNKLVRLLRGQGYLVRNGGVPRCPRVHWDFYWSKDKRSLYPSTDRAFDALAVMAEVFRV